MGKNPYSDLPKSAFWKTGVAQENQYAIEGIYKKKFKIPPKANIATAGSCFAQHISRHLRKNGYNVLDVEPPPPALPNDGHLVFERVVPWSSTCHTVVAAPCLPLLPLGERDAAGIGLGTKERDQIVPQLACNQSIPLCRDALGACLSFAFPATTDPCLLHCQELSTTCSTGMATTLPPCLRTNLVSNTCSIARSRAMDLSAVLSDFLTPFFSRGMGIRI